MKKKILFILGTRPEAIKLQPVILQCLNLFDIKICLTNQHSDIDSILFEFKKYIVSLKLKRDESGLSGLLGNILVLLDNEIKIKEWEPDLIIVHGDTCSSMCGALYAFYNKIKLCHIEAGLRTDNKTSPFPEESNRKIIDYLADIHFAPTELDKQNLINEKICSDNIFVVGNSIIDVIKNYHKCSPSDKSKPYGLVTLHRRENQPDIIKSTLIEVSRFALDSRYNIIYVCNNDEYLKSQVKTIIKDNPYILISDAVNYDKFYQLMSDSSFILTDSGGIQEEAVFLGKPLLIMRESTERQILLNNDCGYLVNTSNVYNMMSQTINNKLKFNYCPNLFGTGNTSLSITDILYANIYQSHNNKKLRSE
jgi:UDP-N-acetylglucosamine 2-epimerase (non-hydrolysing)